MLHQRKCAPFNLVLLSKDSRKESGDGLGDLISYIHKRICYTCNKVLCVLHKRFLLKFLVWLPDSGFSGHTLQFVISIAHFGRSCQGTE